MSCGDFTCLIVVLCATNSLGRTIDCSYNVNSFVGMSPATLALYVPKKDFVCFDGSLTIPYDWINDDYCDCPDGSDEPSTAACPNSHFYCVNKGYKPAWIPSSRVNDGICDCCDGSDEYCNAVNCTDNCFVLRNQALEKMKNQLVLLQKGLSEKQKMIFEAKDIKAKHQLRLTNLEEELRESEMIAKLAERNKVNWEEKHKEIQAESMDEALDPYASLLPEDVFNEMDENKDSLLQADEILIKLKSLEIGESKIKSSLEDEVMYIMNTNSQLTMDDFLEISWNRIKALLTSIDRDNESTYQSLEGQNSETDPLKFDEETQRIVNETINARYEYDKADSAVKEIESRLSYFKQTVEIDYGPNDEFLPLLGRCFSLNTELYNYTVCPFDQIYQTGLDGECKIRLGDWDKWERVGNYSTMIYSGGEECWNGPERWVKLSVKCGVSNRLERAREPDKCYYELEFSSPAACHPAFLHQQTFLHDEL